MRSRRSLVYLSPSNFSQFTPLINPAHKLLFAQYLSDSQIFYLNTPVSTLLYFDLFLFLAH